MNNMTNEDFILILSQKYYKQLYLFAKQICPDKNLASDIVQETFMVAYEKADKLKNHKNIQGWLYRTARNRMLHLLKNALPYEDLSALSETLYDGKNREEESIQILDLYPEMAKHLDPQELDLIIRHYEEGYGYNELAEEYHTSRASVKMRLQRARKKLRENLKIDVFIFFI